MKLHRILVLLVVVAVASLLSATTAFADREWDLSCRFKTKSTASIYALWKEEPDKPLYDEIEEIIDTVPANTYVKKTNGIPRDGVDWVKITYMKDGATKSGWIKDKDLVFCMIYIPDREFGGTTDIHELLYTGDPPAIGSTTTTSGNTSGNSSTNTSSNNNRPSASTPKPDRKATPQVVVTLGDATVVVEVLGTAFSTVSRSGDTYEVPTADLNFGVDVPGDKKLAVIYTPKTGRASLRSSASGDADVLKQCKAGTLVSVLEYGRTYSLINYKNTVGYIMTDCLKFHGVSAETGGKGILSYNGKTNGSTTVNIRLVADGGSRKIGEFKTGTKVTVIHNGDEWCEIEVSGIRGFVMTRYVTILD